MSHPMPVNGMTRTSQLSPDPAAGSPALTGSPTWAPPRSPLPPHRLAKLANALGVSTPLPATQPSPFISYSPSSSPAPEYLRRSPTPSTASSHNFAPYAQPTSKYLLHVIPPLHLPHESDSVDSSELAAPLPNASGYHNQFRRGILVPVYASYQSQLGAIAKEYALPSTAGLILYLVSSNPMRSLNTSLHPGAASQDVQDEPGPRLSEDIWKYLWVRVLKTEQREDNFMLTSRSTTPNPFGLSSGLEMNGTSLRPLVSSGTAENIHIYPLTPSSTSSTITTASSTSELRLNTSSTLASSSSVSQSDPGTPESSAHESINRANSLDLPGLNSSSIIPILAKVEFDIDRRRAPWYEPWIRSRRINQAKRAENRKASMNEGSETNEDRKPPLDLKLTGRTLTASPVSLSSLTDKGKEDTKGTESASKPESEAGYERLSDSTSEPGLDYSEKEDLEEEDGEEDEEEDEEEDATARVASMPNARDPLSDVFGNDADTWAELRNSQTHKTNDNPNIVDLALTSADLANMPETTNFDEEPEKDEVGELLEQISRPQLSVFIPSSPSQSRKHVPPPLMLQPSSNADLVVPVEPSPMQSSSTSSASLAYLHSPSSEERPMNGSTEPAVETLDEEFARSRSPADSEKREGAIFDDLDLGLELSEEFDENDPNDYRKSQFLMKAQLDEIEKTLAQFSPRELRAELSEELMLPLSPRLGLRNGDVLPPTPGLSRLSDLSRSAPSNATPDSGQKAWPAVPFSALKESNSDSPTPDGTPPPPQLAVNGVTTSAPKSFLPRSPSSSDVSAETSSRKREQEEQEASYPPIHPSVRPSHTESPVIPLSPDPFGRYPSSSVESPRQSSLHWETSIPVAAQMNTVAERVTSSAADIEAESRRTGAPSSRFSADSVTGQDVLPKSLKSSTPLVSVKSIKKLWRKSNKSSTSGPLGAQPTGRASPHPVPQRPERPVEEHLDLPSMIALPDTPTFGSFPTQPSPRSRPSQELPDPPSQSSLAPPIRPKMLRAESTLDQLHFDQESPYPARRSPAARYSPRPPSPASATSATVPAPPVPEKEKTSIRKSILKSWRSVSGSSSPVPSNAEPRSSIDRPPSGLRSRRGSVANSGPQLAPSPDIPPSPRIPEQFLNMRLNGPFPRDNRHSSKMSSMDSTQRSRPRSNTSSLVRPSSPQRSVASSRDSQESRPSFDASQFEIVSPKAGSLSYPYHGLDHQ